MLFLQTFLSHIFQSCSFQATDHKLRNMTLLMCLYRQMPQAINLFTKRGWGATLQNAVCTFNQWQLCGDVSQLEYMGLETKSKKLRWPRWKICFQKAKKRVTILAVIDHDHELLLICNCILGTIWNMFGNSKVSDHL